MHAAPSGRIGPELASRARAGGVRRTTPLRVVGNFLLGLSRFVSLAVRMGPSRARWVMAYEAEERRSWMGG